jgi:hypothetical protein
MASERAEIAATVERLIDEAGGWTGVTVVESADDYDECRWLLRLSYCTT